MSRTDVRRAITPLRMIFWGGLLCIFDIAFSQTTNGEGWRFDILNDALGAALILAGAAKLGAIRVHDSYASAMLLVKVAAVACLAVAVRKHFLFDFPTVLYVAEAIVALAALVAIVVFCAAMRWFCQAAGLEESRRLWSIATGLFVFIYLIPLGLFYGACLIALVTESSFHLNLGPAGLLLLPVLAAPVVMIFIATSRMKRQAQLMPETPTQASDVPG